MQLGECAGEFQTIEMKDCDGQQGRIRFVVCLAMLGAQSRMGDAQHRAELCDVQMSHQSDTLSEKC